MSESLLSNKHALLSSLGTMYNDLYYSEANSSVSLVECTFGWQNVIGLSTKSFGSGCQVNIPIDQFVNEVILHLRLPATQANETLCRGWGYGMIESLGFVLGASNSTQIMLQGDSILQAVLAQAPTAEKRTEILKLAGEEQLGAVQRDPVTGELPLLDAYLTLPLPMSTICDKLPLDSTLLSSPIVIAIQFKQAGAVYGGSAVHPSQFDIAELMLRQGKLADQAASLRQAMIAQPDMMYSYPFIYFQNYVSSPFTGCLQNSNTQVNAYRGCQVQLNAFANADLLGIMFWVIADSDKSPSGGSSPNPFNAADISNVLVTYNGSTLFNFPGKSYKLSGAVIGEQQAGYYDYSVISAGNSDPFTSHPQRCYPVFLDFSRLRSACMHEHLFNVFRIANQQLIINFNTPRGSDVTYRLHATYMYNAVAEFQSGTSSVYIG